MPLALSAANKLAEALATMAEFPRFRGSIEATAQDLISLFRDERDDDFCEVAAAALVRDLRTNWDEWPGTAAMFAHYAVKYLGREAPAPANQASEYEKVLIVCQACNDTGVVGSPGVHEWCTCPMAETLRESDPGWLEVLNRPAYRPRPVVPPPPVKWEETAGKDGKGGWVPV